MRIKFKDYEAYKQAQIKVNQQKLRKVWIDDTEIDMICNILKPGNSQLTFGLCHGSRNGYEVNKLSALLKIPVIGTDISETCLQYPNMVVHDFHEYNIDWDKKCDFIYTNSLDHSYDPNKFLINNLKHLKSDGKLFVQHSSSHIKASNYADCFGATLEEYLAVFQPYFHDIHTLKIQSNKGITQNRHLIICRGGAL